VAGDANLLTLIQYLGLHKEETEKSKKVTAVNALMIEFTRRYQHLPEFLGNGYSDDLTANNLKHLKLYADALIGAMQNEKHDVPAEAFTLLEPYGKFIDDKIAETQKDTLNVAA
jgi:hypothetical protein